MENCRYFIQSRSSFRFRKQMAGIFLESEFQKICFCVGCYINLDSSGFVAILGIQQEAISTLSDLVAPTTWDTHHLQLLKFQTGKVVNYSILIYSSAGQGKRKTFSSNLASNQQRTQVLCLRLFIEQKCENFQKLAHKKRYRRSFRLNNNVFKEKGKLKKQF